MIIGDTTRSDIGTALDVTTTSTATELSARYRRGEVTVQSVVEQALGRAEAATRDYGAFAHIDVEGSLDAAKALDKSEPTGLLHGIPVAVKDVIDVAGLPITGGTRYLSGRRASRDASCVAALRAAGAVIVGITVTHELAYGPTGDRSAQGAVRNPHNPVLMAGGSSAGSAVAVATGTVPISLGTDTGGSIRIPASLTGILGLKPTYGAIAREGLIDLAPSLDHVGVHARAVDDLHLAMRVLTSPGRSNQQPRPLRTAWLAEPDMTVIDPAVSDWVRRHTCQVFGQMQDVKLDSATTRRIREDFLVIQGAEALAQHARIVDSRPDLLDPEVLERLRASADLPAWKYVRALKRRDALRRAALRLFDETDVLVSPTTPITAPALDQRTVSVSGQSIAVRGLLLSMTSPWNLLGFPALSVPLPTPGLPVGAQLIAPPGRDDWLLQAARSLTELHTREKESS